MIIKNMKYSVLFGRIVSILSTFFLNWLAARLLVQDQTGQYFLSVSWVWLISLLIQFGSNYSLNRWIPYALEKNDKALLTSRIKSTLLTSLALFILIVLVLSIFSNWLSLQVGYHFMIFIFWVALASVQITIAEIFRSFSRFGFATLIGGPLAQLTTFFLALIFYFQKSTLDIESLVLLTIVGLAVSCSWGVIKIYPLLKSHWTPSLVDWQNSWTRHFDFFLVNILLYTFSQMDIWVVSSLSQKSVVAQYSVGQRVALLASVPASVINLSLMPDFSKWLARNDNEKIQKALRMSAWMGGLPALALVAIVFFFGKYLIQLAFGVNYGESAQIAFVLVLGQTFHYLSGSQGVLLLMAGKQRSVLNSVFFSLCITLMLQVGLFSYYGTIGIAIGSSLGLAVQTLYFMKVSSQELGVTLFRRSK